LSDAADRAQLLLAEARNLSTAEYRLLQAAANVGEARDLLEDDHPAHEILTRAGDAESIRRTRELIREADQVIEPETSGNLEVRA